MKIAFVRPKQIAASIIGIVFLLKKNAILGLSFSISRLFLGTAYNIKGIASPPASANKRHDHLQFISCAILSKKKMPNNIAPILAPVEITDKVLV